MHCNLFVIYSSPLPLFQPVYPIFPLLTLFCPSITLPPNPYHPTTTTTTRKTGAFSPFQLSSLLRTRPPTYTPFSDPGRSSTMEASSVSPPWVRRGLLYHGCCPLAVRFPPLSHPLFLSLPPLPHAWPAASCWAYPPGSPPGSTSTEWGWERLEWCSETL